MKLKLELLNDGDTITIKKRMIDPVYTRHTEECMEYKAFIPTKATGGSAGFDIYSPVDIDLKSGDTVMIPLRFKTEIPQGYMAMMVPRSGSGVKYKSRLCNTIGIIDSDYRGEWVLSLSISGGWDGQVWNIKQGDRIAQFILNEVPNFEIELCEIDETERGDGKFGHTGN